MDRKEMVWIFALVGAAAVNVATYLYNEHVADAMETRSADNNLYTEKVRGKINSIYASRNNKITESDMEYIRGEVEKHDKLCNEAKFAGIF